MQKWHPASRFGLVVDLAAAGRLLASAIIAAVDQMICPYLSLPLVDDASQIAEIIFFLLDELQKSLVVDWKSLVHRSG